MEFTGFLQLPSGTVRFGVNSDDGFKLTIGSGVNPRIQALQLLILDGSPGEGLRATLQIPASAPSFADHFPWRPVFPGSLLLEAQLRLAAQLVRRGLPQAPGLPLVPSHVSDVKLRAFLPPGQAVEIEAKMHSGAGSRGGAVAVAARANGKQVASARVALSPRDSS
jgi:3-hydroxymyristoyl/3-hydroxydecanoyl-(acyl carrier protein) dehydratase